MYVMKIRHFISCIVSKPLGIPYILICQVEMVRIRACAERLHEADRLLTNLAEQRQMAEAAVTAEVLLRKQQLQDSR